MAAVSRPKTALDHAPGVRHDSLAPLYNGDQLAGWLVGYEGRASESQPAVESWQMPRSSKDWCPALGDVAIVGTTRLLSRGCVHLGKLWTDVDNLTYQPGSVARSWYSSGTGNCRSRKDHSRPGMLVGEPSQSATWCVRFLESWTPWTVN